MSVILDALKKLDREKSARRSGSLNIAVEILRPDLPRPEKRILPYVAAVSLATAAITYFIVGEFRSLKKISSPRETIISDSLRQVSSVPPEPTLALKPSPPPSVNSPLASQQALPAPLPREPIRDVREDIRQVAPKTQLPDETKIPSTPQIDKKTDQKTALEEVRVDPGISKKPTEGTPEGSPPAQRSLRISGIIWSEQPSNRLAVINGITITEGSIIEGVKVVEIFPTHVRFLQNDRPFEISLGSSTVLK